MQNDAEYFKAKMGNIDGSGDLGDQLLSLIQAKTIAPELPAKDSKTPTPPPRTSFLSPSNSNGSEKSETDAKSETSA